MDIDYRVIDDPSLIFGGLKKSQERIKRMAKVPVGPVKKAICLQFKTIKNNNNNNLIRLD